MKITGLVGVMKYAVLMFIAVPVCYAEDAVQPGEVVNVSDTADITVSDSVVVNELEEKNRLILDLLKRVEVLEAGLQKNTDATTVVEPEVLDDEQKQERTEAARKIEREREENISLMESAFKRTLVDEGGLLLKPWQFNYVPSISYTHSSSDRIIIDGFTIEEILVVGDIVSRQVKRDIEVLSNAFRLGLENDFQIDLQIPIGAERLQTYSSSGDQTNERTSGLGDISLSLSYQLIKSHVSWPDTLVNINWKSTTGEDPYSLSGDEELALGSGFESWGISFTTVSVSDPVVFFSGLSWTKNMSERKEIGHVDMGDNVGLSMGMVFALNLNTSLSFGFQLSAINQTRIDNQKIPGSNLITSLFTVGVSRILSSSLSMDVQIGVGLTQDSPDVQLSFSFPYSSL
ncbi:MAG: hypothetical protein OQK47_11125 [Gammaproteobacteria bacterium]|nr:hypothetical protein [Gammaproteobacteria bacterium]